MTLRAPVSESLSRLQRDQLQKFAQYLISELPQQILPTAQRLLDELLSAQPSAINTVCGAPDPTAGASASEQTSWCLDDNTLHENIRKILIKFCVPSPTVFSDVNYLSSTAPPAAAEWSSLLRPLRGREPEGMWNLLSIVREMFKRHDRNAVPLLEVLTEECMSCEQIMVWWFNTKVALHNGTAGGGNGVKSNNLGSQSQASMHACSSLCDEIVVLWRLAALNPGLSSDERQLLRQQFSEWHLKVIDKVTKSKGLSSASSSSNGAAASNNHSGGGPATPRRTGQSLKAEIQVFSGFKPAIEACYLSWDDYPVPGVTYTQGHRLYHCPFTCFRHSEAHGRVDIGQINASFAVLKNDMPTMHAHLQRREYQLVRQDLVPVVAIRGSGACAAAAGGAVAAAAEEREGGGGGGGGGGNRSSVSSEGFCENEGDAAFEASPLRHLTRQDSDDPALCSDPADDPEALAADSCNSTDKDKSSPEDGDQDSDWSGTAQQQRRQQLLQQRHSASMVADVQPGTSRDLLQVPAAAHQSSAGSPPASPGLYALPSSGTSGAAAPAMLLSSAIATVSVGAAAVVTRTTTTTLAAHATHKSGVFGELKPLDDPLEILFARAEGLHAHGHSAEACQLGVQLATELLANPPDLMVELPPFFAKNGKKKKTNPVS